MDESRRHAEAWAQEWRLRKRNRTLISVIIGILLGAALITAVSYVSVHIGRTTYRTEAEMKEAVQGRYALESSYMDMVIEDDLVTLTYWSYSHYNKDYAERYGYDYEQDSVYTDHIVKWDHRRGILRTEWMGDLIIDKDGNIHKDSYTVLYKTDRPRPDPIDPATLNDPEGDPAAELSDDAEKAAEERKDDLEATEAVAAAYGSDS